MKMIAISGGLGFVGSNYVNFLRKHYPNLVTVIIDKGTYASNIRNLDHCVMHFQEWAKAGKPKYVSVLMAADIADYDDMQAVTTFFCQNGTPDVFIHMAAESHVDNSLNNASLFAQTNVTGTVRVLEFCKYLDVPKIISMETDEIYGSASVHDFLGFTELAPLNPSSPYSASKAAAALMTKSFVEVNRGRYDPVVTQIRCTNMYGPRQHREKLISKSISLALESKDIPLYGDGMQMRDWLYVEDFCWALDILVHNDLHGPINISANNELSNISVALTIIDAIGLENTSSCISYVEDRPNHDVRYFVDSTKFRECSGWAPEIGFEEGIRRTIEWMTSK